MRYYIKEQKIRPSDIFIWELDAIPDARSCYAHAKLPPANIHRPAPNRSNWDEAYRLRLFAQAQQKLLNQLRYTHTIIVDLDEFVLPSARYGGLLHNYLRHSPFALRGMVAPTSYMVLNAPSLGERGELDWHAYATASEATDVPALLAHRHLWMRNCGGSKPVLVRERPVHYTFSTHMVAELPWYNPFHCLTNATARVRDCVDEELLMVHMKCSDPQLFQSAPLALRRAWQRDRHQMAYVVDFFGSCEMPLSSIEPASFPAHPVPGRRFVAHALTCLRASLASSLSLRLWEGRVLGESSRCGH